MEFSLSWGVCFLCAKVTRSSPFLLAVDSPKKDHHGISGHVTFILGGRDELLCSFKIYFMNTRSKLDTLVS